MENKGVRLVIVEGKPYIVPAVLAAFPELLKKVFPQ